MGDIAHGRRRQEADGFRVDLQEGPVAGAVDGGYAVSGQVPVRGGGVRVLGEGEEGVGHSPQPTGRARGALWRFFMGAPEGALDGRQIGDDRLPERRATAIVVGVEDQLVPEGHLLARLLDLPDVFLARRHHRLPCHHSGRMRF